MNWGDRNLEAEVLDGRGRKTLSLGDRAEDDVVIGGGARIHLAWSPTGVDVRFSTGVSGSASFKGEGPLPLGQLIERGLVKDEGDVFTCTLRGADSVQFQVVNQVIEVQQARGRIARLRIDLMATTALVVGLILLGLWLGSTILPMQPLNLIPKTKPRAP